MVRFPTLDASQNMGGTFRGLKIWVAPFVAWVA
jgi:hypothetical protein